MNGSIFSTKSLVNTNVDPPRNADKEAKKEPKTRFLKIIWSLFMKSYLLD